MQIANELTKVGDFQTLEEILGEVLGEDGKEKMERVAERLCRRRKEAIMARQSSGIEAKWRWCEMAFSGEDDTTAGSSTSEEFRKSTSGGGTLITKGKETQSCRSTAVLNITGPAVEFAGWAVLQLAAPTEKQRWGLIPTPMTDVDEALQFLEQFPPEAAEALRGSLERARLDSREGIEAAEKQVQDWFAESPEPFQDLLMVLFEDASRMGSGILKGPVPMKGKKGIQPGFKRVSVTDIFPLPDCGANIRDGSGLFERDTLSKRRLMEKRKPLAALDGWIPTNVLEVLKEGPKGVEGTGNASPKEFELWYYYGLVPKSILSLVGLPAEEDVDEVWATVALVNDRIVKVGPAPLDNEIPYHLLKWRKRWINGKEFWAGKGIAEEGESIQRSATGHLRNLNDNSALAAVPQRIHWKGVLKPKNGRYEWAPGKDWEVTEKEFSAENIKTVANAMMFINIPAHLPELRANIEMDLRLFEKVTGIGEMVLGQSEPGSVGGGQMTLNAAAHLPRRVKKNFDKDILRPAVSLSLDWIRKYKTEELPLGETTVTIEGSATEIKRDVQASSLIQAISQSLNPVYGQDPALLMDKYLEGNELDPEATKLTEERKQELAALMAPEPDEKAQAAVQSAQLRAGALTEQGAMKAQSHQLETMVEAENEARKREHEEKMLVMKMKMELIQYAQKKGVDLEVAQKEFEMLEIPRMAVEKMTERPKETSDATS